MCGSIFACKTPLEHFALSGNCARHLFLISRTHINATPCSEVEPLRPRHVSALCELLSARMCSGMYDITPTLLLKHIDCIVFLFSLCAFVNIECRKLSIIFTLWLKRAVALCTLFDVVHLDIHHKISDVNKDTR